MKQWNDYDWSDIEPIFIPEENRQLARINYSEDFAVAMAYLRALQPTQEISERALTLTQDILEMNPAHYSVWDYRFKIVTEIGNKVYDPKEVGLVRISAYPPIGEDGSWLNDFTLEHPKNYQIWNYRQHLVDPTSEAFFRGEQLLVHIILEDDSKNFHAWSHYKWAIQAAPANTFNVAELLEYADSLLKADVWNNSAWSFRFFIFQYFPDALEKHAELEYVTQKIEEAPQNESVWSYAKGMFKPSEILPLAQTWSSQSCRAKELLAALYHGNSEYDEAAKLYAELCIDEPVRQGFWRHMQDMAKDRKIL